MDLDRGYYALWALFVYGVFLLYLLAPVPGKRPVVPVCACVVTLCLSALLTAKTVQRQDLALTVLDVGQGQSVVVTSGHARALIDCGGTRDPGDTAATYLQSLGRSELDLLILTHFHADHAGGVLELMDRVKVRALGGPRRGPGQPAPAGDYSPGGGGKYSRLLCDGDQPSDPGPGGDHLISASDSGEGRQ